MSQKNNSVQECNISEKTYKFIEAGEPKNKIYEISKKEAEEKGFVLLDQFENKNFADEKEGKKFIKFITYDYTKELFIDRSLMPFCFILPKLSDKFEEFVLKECGEGACFLHGEYKNKARMFFKPSKIEEISNFLDNYSVMHLKQNPDVFKQTQEEYDEDIAIFSSALEYFRDKNPDLCKQMQKAIEQIKDEQQKLPLKNYLNDKKPKTVEQYKQDVNKFSNLFESFKKEGKGELKELVDKCLQKASDNMIQKMQKEEELRSSQQNKQQSSSINIQNVGGGNGSRIEEEIKKETGSNKDGKSNEKKPEKKSGGFFSRFF
jgi:hypothetical protein